MLKWVYYIYVFVGQVRSILKVGPVKVGEFAPGIKKELKM